MVDAEAGHGNTGHADAKDDEEDCKSRVTPDKSGRDQANSRKYEAYIGGR